MTHPQFVSYAQNREDVMLWRALRDQTPGFYIDIGASDPDLLSVTRAFHERGWRGLDVEPLPEKAALLRQARPGNVVVQAAVSATPGTAIFHRVRLNGETGLSTLDATEASRSGGTVEPIRVEVTTLAALCREHVDGEVHFLKIDAEGAEAEVLRGADFGRTRPWIVVVEATRPLSAEPARDEWEPMLLAAGYCCVWFDGLNRFYLAEERHAALVAHFQVPPNAFDDYRVADPVPSDRLLAAEAAAAQLRAEIAGLQAELTRLRTPPQTPPSPAPPVFLPQHPEPPRPGSWALRLAYAALRPVLRPLAWRLRSFLLGPVRDELAGLDARQAACLARLDQIAAATADPAFDASLARALEAVLLTVAVEREQQALSDPGGDAAGKIAPAREAERGRLGPETLRTPVVHQ